MNQINHFLLSWSIANGSYSFKTKDRFLITLAGVVPDADGLGIVVEKLTKDTAYPLLWWSKFHHVLLHNITFSFAYALAAYFISKNKLPVAILCLLSMQVHLFSDMLIGRGVDGELWTVFYFEPFSILEIAWSGQIPLNSWPNFVIAGVLLASTFYVAWKSGVSPLEFVSKKANDVFVETIRRRFGQL